MTFDLDMIKKHYKNMPSRVDIARDVLKRPLTYTEKVLFSHLEEETLKQEYNRGGAYVNFLPDRAALQDATSQMVILQFMQAGKKRVAIPTTVHCDHLIQAESGAKQDLATAIETNREVYDFLSSSSNKYGLGFLETGGGNYPSSGFGKLRFSRRDVDRDRFAYGQRWRSRDGGHWGWRS